MLTKILVGVVVALGATAGGVYLATANADSKGCCFPGSECCYPGSPCCETQEACCLTLTKAEPVAVAKSKSCCGEGAACCEVVAPCCAADAAK